MTSVMSPIGTVNIKVYDSNFVLKSESTQHNIITKQGDSYIADQLSISPQRQKINATNCYIVVGTGYTGANNKTQTWVNTQVGPAQLVSTGYPRTGGVWGASGQDVLEFSFTFAAGLLNVVGLNEACIVSTQSLGALTSCLAYVNLNTTDVSASDSLQISWSIQFNGS